MNIETIKIIGPGIICIPIAKPVAQEKGGFSNQTDEEKIVLLLGYLQVVLSSVKLNTTVNFSEIGNSEVRLKAGLPNLYLF